MPQPFREAIVEEAVANRVFSPGESVVLLGLIGELEDGVPFIDAVTQLEETFLHSEEILETIDKTTSWLRAERKRLALKFF